MLIVIDSLADQEIFKMYTHNTLILLMMDFVENDYHVISCFGNSGIKPICTIIHKLYEGK